MKWAFFAAGIVVLGLIVLVVLVLFEDVTVSNEQDYYLLKEITEASMYESIDIVYYRKTGELKMIEQKFVDSFIRRYAESTSFNSDEYTIEFYDIMESPPKVSIVIKNNVGSYNIDAGSADDTGTETYTIVNQLDAILEFGTN